MKQTYYRDFLNLCPKYMNLYYACIVFFKHFAYSDDNYL